MKRFMHDIVIFLACGVFITACGDSGSSQSSSSDQTKLLANTSSCNYPNWAVNTNYVLGTIVQYTNGSLYKLVNVGPNGSNGTNPTISTWYWSPDTSTSCSYPNWAAGTIYPVGTIVRYTNGNLYKLINAMSNGSNGIDPIASTWYWTPYASSACGSVTWVAGTNYALGAIVRYTNGNLYKLVNVGTNGSDATNPTVSTWYWSQTSCSSGTSTTTTITNGTTTTTAGSGSYPTWIAGTNYPVGTVVQYANGNLYKLVNAMGNGSNSINPIVSTWYWSPYTSTSCSYVTWAAGIVYPVGTLVKYTDGNYYTLINAMSNGSNGIDPVASTWYWKPATCGGSTTTPPGGFIFSPYKYTDTNFNHSTNAISTNVNGTAQSILSAMPSNLSTLTLAFARGECGNENWVGVSPSVIASNLQSFIAAGKKYIISTGGAADKFTCASDAGFTTFINHYYSANMLGVDFDIEGTQTQTEINDLVKRAVAAQHSYPNLRFSFTVLTSGGTAPYAMQAPGVMSAINNYGLTNYTINLMAMDYNVANVGSCLINSAGLCNMGTSAVQAALDLHTEYGVPYSQIEVTVMIGGNDRINDIFTITDVSTLSTFAIKNGLAGLHFWSFDRDNDCAPDPYGASGTCNTYGTAGTLGFTKAFLNSLSWF